MITFSSAAVRIEAGT